MCLSCRCFDQSAQTAVCDSVLTSLCSDSFTKINSFHYMWKRHLEFFHALELSVFQSVVHWVWTDSFSELAQFWDCSVFNSRTEWSWMIIVSHLFLCNQLINRFWQDCVSWATHCDDNDVELITHCEISHKNISDFHILLSQWPCNDCEMLLPPGFDAENHSDQSAWFLQYSMTVSDHLWCCSLRGFFDELILIW